MFDDPNKDLERMERRLLEVEEEEQWLDVYRLLEEEDPQPGQDLDATQIFCREEMPVRNYANGYGRDLPRQEYTRIRDEEYCDEEEPEAFFAPEGKSNNGLILLALLETAGIVGVVVYWLVKLL